MLPSSTFYAPYYGCKILTANAHADIRGCKRKHGYTYRHKSQITNNKYIHTYKYVYTQIYKKYTHKCDQINLRNHDTIYHYSFPDKTYIDPIPNITPITFLVYTFSPKANIPIETTTNNCITCKSG